MIHETCPKHPSIKLIEGACTSCLMGNPPDLGVNTGDESETTEIIS